MKQGSGKSSDSGRKIEPRSKAKNPGKVGNIGIQTIRTRPYKNLGDGYKAPMASPTNHKRGTQGKH